MSEENVDQSGGAPVDGGGAGVDVTELQKQLDALKAKNEELMGDVKSKSRKLKSFEEKQVELEEKRLQEEGKYKELLELEKKKNLGLGQKFKTRLMDSQIKEAAKAAGCTNVNAFMKLVGNYEDSVKFNDDFEADSESLGSFINELKDEYKELALFKSDVKAPADAGTGDAKPAPKTSKQAAVDTFMKLSGA